MKPNEIHLSPIVEVPAFAQTIVYAIGLASINWGKMEQTLELLLQYLNDERLITGRIARFPDTSFRLKAALFEKWYAQHPLFESVHPIAKPVCIGLRKANQSRVRVTHCNVQGFSEGPPARVHARILKFKGSDLITKDGAWTFDEVVDFNTLVCHLCDDLGRIASIVINPEFRQSLERELSRTQKASLWVRHFLHRIRYQCNRRFGIPA